MFNSKFALLGVFASAVVGAFAHPSPNPAAVVEKREFSRLFRLTAHNVLNANNTGVDNTPRDIFIASNGGSQEFGWFAVRIHTHFHRTTRILSLTSVTYPTSDVLRDRLHRAPTPRWQVDCDQG
ncbi:hypothetical protein K474DRAFT_1505653 [Panus rudis PR-1116 ss-1]|nr:hypothetical protein K474DRAFT_1505653 [Panus rudis PR-1116 ss-1]